MNTRAREISKLVALTLIARFPVRRVKARFFSVLLAAAWRFYAARFSRRVSSPSRHVARAPLRGRRGPPQNAERTARYQSGRGARPAGYHWLLSLSLVRARVPTSILASPSTLYLARLALRRSCSSDFHARTFSLSPHVRLSSHRSSPQHRRRDVHREVRREASGARYRADVHSTRFSAIHFLLVRARS